VLSEPVRNDLVTGERRDGLPKLAEYSPAFLSPLHFLGEVVLNRSIDFERAGSLPRVPGNPFQHRVVHEHPLAATGDVHDWLGDAERPKELIGVRVGGERGTEDGGTRRRQRTPGPPDMEVVERRERRAR